jgi:hypothetical protein
MLPRRPSLFVAAAVAVLAVHALTMLGRAASEAALAFCAFALMIGAPVAVLVWFGSLTDREANDQARRRRLQGARAEALLWQRTLHDLQPAWAPLVHSEEKHVPASRRARVAAALAPWLRREAWLREERSIPRSILALCLAVASTLGLAGCGVPAEAWAMVRPGMGTTELVSLVGGPDYIRTNGYAEVWQYCRDFPGRDEGRYARYYTAVLVSGQTVKEVQPYPVASSAGCEDFYRAEF